MLESKQELLVVVQMYVTQSKCMLHSPCDKIMSLARVPNVDKYAR